VTTCSALAAALGEPLHATAPFARSWLLVEDPSPWGRKAVRDVGLGALEARAKESGVRVGLVRRCGREGRRREQAGPRRALLAHCSAPEPFVELLADADLEALDLERPNGGERLREPLYLVCTNGRRDACCARAGTAVARALEPRLGDRLWETTHVGGHRFAANLVALPHGLVFGRLDGETATTVVDAYERGLIELDHLRGRTSRTPHDQAVEHFARLRDGLRGLDDPLPPDAPAVEAYPLEPPRKTSCDGGPERPVAWRLRREKG
jgi:hypothetical protein